MDPPTNPDDPSENRLNKFFKMDNLLPRDVSDLGISEEVRFSQIMFSFYLDDPVLGEIAVHLEPYATKSSLIPTFGCNSRTIYFNSNFTSTKNRSEIKGILAHCIIHLIFDHYNKINDKNNFLFKIAIELSTQKILYDLISNINEKLRYFSDNYRRSWDTYDTDNVIDKFMKYDYNEIYASIDYLWREGYDNSNNVSRPATFRDTLNESQKERILEIVGLENCCQYWQVTEILHQTLNENNQLENDRIRGIIKQLIHKHGFQGYVPKELKMTIEDEYIIRNPWYTVLERYLHEMLRSDWLWLPPNRRYVNDNLYFPTTKKKNFRLYVGLNCNSSIDDEMANKLLVEIYNIISTIFSFELRIIGFHNEIVFDILLDDASYFHRISEVSMKTKDNNTYTSFPKLFEYIENQINEPDLLIIFSPSSTAGGQMKPNYQVLWITLSNVPHQFGDSIILGGDTEIKTWDYQEQIVSEDEEMNKSSLKTKNKDAKEEKIVIYNTSSVKGFLSLLFLLFFSGITFVMVLILIFLGYSP